MNYIKLINAFWQKRREQPEFDPYVISLFFALVSKANYEGWKSFEIYREDITALAGMSPSVYYKARKTLKDAGFIEFKEGASKLSQCRFKINQLYSENTEGYTEGSTEGDTEERQKAIQKTIPSNKTNKLINSETNKPLDKDASLTLDFKEKDSETLTAKIEKPKEKSSAQKEKGDRRPWANQISFEDKDTPELRAKWQEWIDYKLTCPKPKVVPYSTLRGEQAALNEVGRFATPFAMWAIDNAIEKEWQGIVNESTHREYERYGTNPAAFLASKGRQTLIISKSEPKEGTPEYYAELKKRYTFSKTA